MNFGGELLQKILLGTLLPLLSLFGNWFFKEYLPEISKKQDVDKALSMVRKAHKEQLEILRISREIDSHTKNNSIILYRNAEKWQQDIISTVPSGKVQKSLLGLNPYTTASGIYSNNNEDKNPLKVPVFINFSEFLLSLLGLSMSLMLFLFSLFFIYISIGENNLNIILWGIISLFYMTFAIILFTGFDSLSIAVSGSVLADIFYRKIAYKNNKDVEKSNKAIRVNRIRASASDKTIKEYVYIPKTKINFLWLGELIPALPFFRGAILRSTNYGYIKDLEDECMTDPIDLKEKHKISWWIVSRILDDRKLTAKEESKEE